MGKRKPAVEAARSMPWSARADRSGEQGCFGFDMLKASLTRCRDFRLSGRGVVGVRFNVMWTEAATVTALAGHAVGLSLSLSFPFPSPEKQNSFIVSRTSGGQLNCTCVQTHLAPGHALGMKPPTPGFRHAGEGYFRGRGGGGVAVETGREYHHITLNRTLSN